jgi:glucose-6-phosphate 1-epimerase
MAEQKKLANGFEYIELENSSARAKIALQGAHVFHFERVGEKPLLWLSGASFFEQDKAIRGGIPLCWPWFGKHSTDPSGKPQHGFARNVKFTLLDIDETDPLVSRVVLELRHSGKSLKLWPHEFTLLVKISVGKTLTINLITKNTGKTPFELTSALHTYFMVSDISNVSVKGLDKTPYFDALSNENKFWQGDITIDEEVDRVYQNVHYPLTLHDQNRILQINSKGSASAVVWNPWIKKCASMGDMPDNGYKTMLCIETANALDDHQLLAPGEEHTLAVSVS